MGTEIFGAADFKGQLLTSLMAELVYPDFCAVVNAFFIDRII
jgi:hypothetical protein